MQHPKEIGDRSQLAITLALRDAGLAVYLPFGENTRCDLIVEDCARLYRVQCKTGRLRSGTIWFNVCSSYGHHRNPSESRRTYDGQIDYFAVFCPDTAGVYMVPIEDVRVRTQAGLRVEPTRNNQQQRVRLAADYEIARIAVEKVPGRPAGCRPGTGSAG